MEELEAMRAQLGDHTIIRWAVRRSTKSGGRVTVQGMHELSRPQGLRYEDTGSPLGGRISGHLEHLEEQDIDRLMARADAFLAGSKPEPGDDSR